MSNNSEILDKLKLFSMKNLMLESDLIGLEKSGVEIGHIKTIKKDEVIDLELFEFDIRKQARRMADFYPTHGRKSADPIGHPTNTRGNRPEIYFLDDKPKLLAFGKNHKFVGIKLADF